MTHSRILLSLAHSRTHHDLLETETIKSLENNPSEPFLISLLFSLTLIQLFAYSLPRFLSRNTDQFSIKTIRILSIVNTFFAALFIGGSILILLPNALNELSHLSSKARNHELEKFYKVLPFLFFLTGFFLIHILNVFAYCCRISDKMDADSDDELYTPSRTKFNSPVDQLHQIDHSSIHYQNDLSKTPNSYQSYGNYGSTSKDSYNDTHSVFSAHSTHPYDQIPLSRCLFCQQNVYTERSSSFHSAGCSLSYPNESISAQCQSYVSLRGRRLLKRYMRLSSRSLSALVALQAVIQMFGLAFLVNFTEPQTLKIQILNYSILFAMAFYLAFGVGLQVRVSRCSSFIWATWAIVILMGTILGFATNWILAQIGETEIYSNGIKFGYMILCGYLIHFGINEIFTEELIVRNSMIDGGKKWAIFIGTFVGITVATTLG